MIHSNYLPRVEDLLLFMAVNGAQNEMTPY